MKAANFGPRHNAASADGLNPAALGWVFAEREVSAGTVVVRQIGAKHASKMSLVEDDDMVQTLSTDRPDHTLDVGVLPRRARCGAEGREADRFDGAAERRIEGRVAVVEEASRGRVF